jgi:hypothetical protein
LSYVEKKTNIEAHMTVEMVEVKGIVATLTTVADAKWDKQKLTRAGTVVQNSGCFGRTFSTIFFCGKRNTSTKDIPAGINSLRGLITSFPKEALLCPPNVALINRAVDSANGLVERVNQKLIAKQKVSITIDGGPLAHVVIAKTQAGSESTSTTTDSIAAEATPEETVASAKEEAALGAQEAAQAIAQPVVAQAAKDADSSDSDDSDDEATTEAAVATPEQVVAVVVEKSDKDGKTEKVDSQIPNQQRSVTPPVDKALDDFVAQAEGVVRPTITAGHESDSDDEPAAAAAGASPSQRPQEKHVHFSAKDTYEKLVPSTKNKITLRSGKVV